MLLLEVLLEKYVCFKKTDIEFLIIEFLMKEEKLLDKYELPIFKEETHQMMTIHIEQTNSEVKPKEINKDNTKFFFYELSPIDMESDTLDDEGNDQTEVPCMNHYLLPNAKFKDLWDNLIYDEGLKEKLLYYGLSGLEFANHKVNSEIITCNRLLLLHGPPGTGKTSLCKALAQKMAIRTKEKYLYTHLIEINSHSLFSKWFSESGKLVMRLFTKIREILMDKNNLVCVLIDEVESIAFSRTSMSSEEPKDAMRVVNALLTQLDSLKEYSNVCIFATSNISESIDAAFLDRADIKQFIGMPTLKSRINMLATIFQELKSTGIIDRHDIDLKEIGKATEGINGRTIRKLPFLVYADMLRQHASLPMSTNIFVQNMLLKCYEVLSSYK